MLFCFNSLIPTLSNRNGIDLTLYQLSLCPISNATASLFFFQQSLIGLTLLECVNYIEHYGLRRASPSDRVTPLHSWNAGHRLTNYFVFKLQRHSDHHAYATRRYQILRSWNQSPQMPTGYAGMLLLALIPPLWFRIMNPRITAVLDQQRQWKEDGVDPFKAVPSS